MIKHGVNNSVQILCHLMSLDLDNNMTYHFQLDVTSEQIEPHRSGCAHMKELEILFPTI